MYCHVAIKVHLRGIGHDHRASVSLPPSVRDAFLKLIANRLSGYPEQARGVGLVYRIAAEVQRDFLKAGPIAVGRKYSRSQPLRQGQRRL
jgi:hypothetical protein